MVQKGAPMYFDWWLARSGVEGLGVRGRRHQCVPPSSIQHVVVPAQVGGESSTPHWRSYSIFRSNS